MKKNKIIILIFCGFSLFLNSCQSTKEALSGSKKDNTDEFLVKKKNPLVLPPDFDELPLPKNSMKKIDGDNNSLKKILETESKNSNSQNKSSKNKSLKESIKKILNED
jgi:hypothetical protein